VTPDDLWLWLYLGTPLIGVTVFVLARML